MYALPQDFFEEAWYGAIYDGFRDNALMSWGAQKEWNTLTEKQRSLFVLAYDLLSAGPADRFWEFAGHSENPLGSDREEIMAREKCWERCEALSKESIERAKAARCRIIEILTLAGFTLMMEGVDSDDQFLYDVCNTQEMVLEVYLCVSENISPEPELTLPEL